MKNHHVRLEDQGETLRFTIHKRRKLLEILFYSFCFVPFVVGYFFVFAAGISFLMPLPSVTAFSVCMLAFAILGFAILTTLTILNFRDCLWVLVGKETIEVNQHWLKDRRTIFGLGRTYIYAAQSIVNFWTHFTISTMFGQSEEGFSMPRWLNRGTLSLYYEGRYERFGIDLTVDEADMIVQQIKDRFPVYRGTARIP